MDDKGLFLGYEASAKKGMRNYPDSTKHLKPNIKIHAVTLTPLGIFWHILKSKNAILNC